MCCESCSYYQKQRERGHLIPNVLDSFIEKNPNFMDVLEGIFHFLWQDSAGGSFVGKETLVRLTHFCATC